MPQPELPAEPEPEPEPTPSATTRPPDPPAAPPTVTAPVPDGAVSEPSDDGEPLPDECLLAPVDPNLPDETFELRGSQVAVDFTPPEGERWNWAGEDAEEPNWPYPSRPLWPSAVELPNLVEADFEFTALAGASREDLYVVGRRQDAALVLHFAQGVWTDESSAALAALPTATAANSVAVARADQIWVSTPEGLLRSDGTSEWALVEVPAAVLPLGAVWMNETGFGVVAGGSVATTKDAGASFELEARELGFVAPGLAYSRSFARVAGHGDEVAVVGTYGHLLTRSEQGWTASTLLSRDVAFTADGQFVTTRNPSGGLFFRDAPEVWQIYPLTLDGGLDRVWASEQGDVFAGGDLYGVLHRFPDGTLELLPSEVSGLVDFYGDASFLYALAPTSLWAYELGEVDSSGITEAALLDDSLQGVTPRPETSWGQSAASNFEPLSCVDEVLLGVGAPVWQGELAQEPAEARYGSCSNATERQFSETAFSFTAPTAGSYRIVLDEPEQADSGEPGTLRLALRNGCEGWLIWGGGGFSANAKAVDIGLEAGQVILIEVYASQELDAPAPFELSIH